MLGRGLAGPRACLEAEERGLGSWGMEGNGSEEPADAPIPKQPFITETLGNS